MHSIWKRHRSGPSPFTVIVRGDVVRITCRPTRPTPSPTQCWYHAQCLSNVLQRATTMRAATVVIDLQALANVSTSLLAVLVEARVRARHAGIELVLCGSPALARITEICRLQTVLPMA